MRFINYFSKKIFFSIGTFALVIICAYVFLYSSIANSNKPIISELFNFLKNVFNGFGELYTKSLKLTFNSAFDLFWSYFYHSLLFLILTICFSIILGISIGIFIGYKHNSISEKFVSIFVFAAISIPTFILAPIMIVIAQNNDIPIMYLKPDEYGIWWNIASLIIPVCLLSLLPISYISTVTKNTILQTLSENYVVQMKAIGMSNYDIFNKTVFKKIIANLVSQSITILAITLSISFILERVFQIPGQSLLIISMFQMKEINVLMCFITINLLIFLTLNLISETTYIALNNLFIGQSAKSHLILNLKSMLKRKGLTNE
ncbi:ABC transporter permease subunit [Mycoplasmopsis iners]|uniref:ABC transporter permease subunit n=1 Tax=Mycoplasmopsis iners TaxID=76630 RepID=UPI000691BFA6|nr:ABC transporter permease [Mycoplasmopsis iners]